MSLLTLKVLNLNGMFNGMLNMYIFVEQPLFRTLFYWIIV